MYALFVLFVTEFTVFAGAVPILPWKKGLFMNRSIEKSLIDWKNDPGKRSLLVRGTRQVGKS